MKSIVRKPGYVLALAMGFIAIVSVLVTGLVHRVMVFHRVQYALIDREQARLLALGGVNIAIAQLTNAKNAKKKNDQKQQAQPPKAPAPGASQQPEDDQAQKASPEEQLKKLVVLMNRWQTFAFDERTDGITGTCEIYIASERGKIDLNSIYDFAQRKFIKLRGYDGEKICQLVGEKLSSIVKSGNFAEFLASFLKERGHPLDDLSQLIADKRFASLRDRLFVTPSGGTPTGGTPTGGIALFDLFTIETQQAQVQPWFISSAVGSILGFQVGKGVDTKIWQKSLEKLPPSMSTIKWQEDWDKLLFPVYGKEYAKLSGEVKSIFADKFESAPFSVVSYGKFGAFTTKVYAIIEEKMNDQNKAAGYGIRKLYWL